MRITYFFFGLLVSAASLKAQTVSSISTGNPGCAIIEGNIVDEGKSFTFNGATYTIKKITADAVTVVDDKQIESTLIAGAAPLNKSSTEASRQDYVNRLEEQKRQEVQDQAKRNANATALAEQQQRDREKRDSKETLRKIYEDLRKEQDNVPKRKP
jgi:uncharacterized protein (DUF1800 family)